jgi:hypothetical protein
MSLPCCSLLLDSFLFVLLSRFQSDTLDYPVCTHSLSARSARCQFLSDYLLQIHESLSLFLYLTKALFFSFTPRTITYPMASSASSPKAFRALAYFISVPFIV